MSLFRQSHSFSEKSSQEYGALGIHRNTIWCIGGIQDSSGSLYRLSDNELDGCSFDDRLSNCLISFLHMLHNLWVVADLFLVYFSEK